jgi:hypothetical protein
MVTIVSLVVLPTCGEIDVTCRVGVEGVAGDFAHAPASVNQAMIVRR